MMNIKDF